MRILYLAQLLPYPLDAGAKVRMYYVLRHLAAAGHDITLLAFSRATDSPAGIDHLREFCAEVHTVPMARSRARDGYHLLRSLFQDRPFLIARDDVAAMHAAARDLVRTRAYDAIHADQLWMAAYALAAAEAAPRRPGLVLDQHNATYLIPSRLAQSSTGLPRILLQRESVALRRYELETCGRFDHVVWVTAEDRDAIDLLEHTVAEKAPQQHVIPICVDPTTHHAVDRVDFPHRVTFIGGLHWPPNATGITWFAREVWPRVRAACPGTTLTVIGKNPPAGLAGVDDVELTGYVEDSAAYLRETAVFIVPLFAGGGMRVKILDAWCWGLPVVATPIGAEGIGYAPGRDLLVADDAAGFAAAVSRVWHDKALAESLAAGGRRTVEAGYDWRRVYRQWDEIYAVPVGAEKTRL